MICIADVGGTERVISPLFDPPLFAEFVVISPARRALAPQARLFLEALEAEIRRVQDLWATLIPPTMFPERNNKRRSARTV
jgi:LysR family nitrogen assimilation transcriptional regulator